MKDEYWTWTDMTFNETEQEGKTKDERDWTGKGKTEARQERGIPLYNSIINEWEALKDESKKDDTSD